MNEAPGRGGARAASAALGGFARAGRAGRAAWPGLSARTKPLCCVRPHEKGAAGRSAAPHRYSNFYNYFVVHYSATALGALSVKIDAVSAAAAAARGQRLKALPALRFRGNAAQSSGWRAGARSWTCSDLITLSRYPNADLLRGSSNSTLVAMSYVGFEKESDVGRWRHQSPGSAENARKIKGRYWIAAIWSTKLFYDHKQNY